MKKSRRKRKCEICGRKYTPDRYNYYHQKCCSDPACQKSGKRLSSKRYRHKKRRDPEFRKAEVKRVEKWRKKNPGYRKKKSKRKKTQKNSETNDVLRDFGRGENDAPNKMLRDFALFQMHCLQGLVVNLTGALRDDIGSLLNNYYDRGKALFPELEKQFYQGEFSYDPKENDRSGSPQAFAGGFRVDRPPPGP
jgi:hypothetical protein